ncbi:DNA polymerase III subunit chi [Thioalkalivibrio paradoxus]|uniref:DNA polymerase III subunit chi n=1 Tax=Thioalkalivibrio paradoxus ARh 1 TaxID=713585 RepID=W0DKK2_9GAMM|nr:DNA polymerase III subunit chi [Thioalkalivibrio paradoxus]AHE97533.1 DNA polymerase III subunit chi [Thioalkalivibrio paradoxus ARh 1]
MTRVAFYLLAARDEQARRLFACRLARKVSRMGHRVHIHTPDAGSTDEMDRLLWTFEDIAFLPHGTDVNDPDSPVTVHDQAAPADRCDVLINLAPEVPEYFGRFERVADLIGSDPAARARGRERYRFFKERGYPLEHHEIGD